ncbi:MAG: 16S rRNA (guanine(527)-N(7))-methyltransferase RsmG [Desulfuromonadales bacterium]
MELLRRLDLKVAPEAIPLLERLTDDLLRWNSRRNLTAIIDRDEVLEKHIADSLTLLPFARQATHLLDIGSGAGFPSLPLKIVCPELKVVSVDAVGKKVDFQRHIARTLGLTGFTALHERAEKLTDYLAVFDLITARALCSLADLVELAGPLLAPGGRLVAMKGPEGCLEFIEHQSALQQEGWSAVLHNLKLPVSGAVRCLIELTR